MYMYIRVHVVHACTPDIYVLFQQGESLLHAATSSGQLEVVKFLHDKLADVKAVDKVNICHKRHGTMITFFWALQKGDTVL